MARTNGPIRVWHRGDTIPTDPEGGYAGGDSTAAAVGGAMAQAGQAVATVDNLSATATALPPGSSPTVTVTGPIPNKVINIGIPRGEPGMGYEEGQQLLADSQAVVNDSTALLSDYGNLVTRAENAEAAAFAEPDEAMATVVGNPATETHAALNYLTTEAGRRETFANIASQGTGGWYVTRRSEDEYRLSQDIGGGYWSDYQIHRNVRGTAVQENPSLSIHDVGVGMPMVAVPDYEATYTGGSWVNLTRWSDGSLPPPGVTLFPDATRTVTTTAGSSTVVVSPSTYTDRVKYHGRAIHIPGAGAGGADYYGVMNDAGGMVVSPAPETSVTGVPIYFYGRRKWTNSAGRVATYTTPAGSTRAGIIFGRAGSGGLHTVAINGDLTRATDLPTAQDLVDTGEALDTILTTNGGTIAPTTRVLDTYALLEQYAAWRSLAHDLPPGEHTVTVTTTAHRGTGAGGGSILYITGWGHGSPSTTLDTPDSYIFASTMVGKPLPTNDYALEVAPTSGGESIFLGGIGHGYETETSAASVSIDGSTTPLADGDRAPVAHAASITKTSRLNHPSDMTDPVADVTSTYTPTPRGLVVNNSVTWRKAATIPTAYLAMWTPSAALRNFQLSGGAQAWNMSDLEDSEFAGQGKSSAAVWWQDGGGQIVTAVYLPAASKMVGGWGVNSYTNIRKFRDSTKFYPRRSGSAAPGDRWASDVMYLVGRLPAGGDFYFPTE